MNDMFADGKLQELDGVDVDGCVEWEQRKFWRFVCAKTNRVVSKCKIHYHPPWLWMARVDLCSLRNPEGSSRCSVRQHKASSCHERSFDAFLRG